VQVFHDALERHRANALGKRKGALASMDHVEPLP